MIRNMLPEDRQEYLRLSGIFYSSDAVAYTIPKAQYEKTFNELITGNPYLRGLMIECEGEIAGFALLALTYSNEAGGMVVWLEELFILPEFQGRGLGSEFFPLWTGSTPERPPGSAWRWPKTTPGPPTCTAVWDLRSSLTCRW